jgi:hypothetical protein
MAKKPITRLASEMAARQVLPFIPMPANPAYAFQNVGDAPYVPGPGTTTGGMSGNYFTNNTPVVRAGDYTLRGMQGPAGFQPENYVDPALLVAGMGGPALAGRMATSKANRVAGIVGDELFGAATQGFDRAAAGGRIFTTQTPFGPTTGSTRIMSEPQLNASMGNLAKWYQGLSDVAGRSAGNLAGQNVMSQAMKMYAAALAARTYGPTIRSRMQE